MTRTAEIDRALTAWKKAVARGDARKVAELVTEDAEFWSHGAAAVRGKQAVQLLFSNFFEQYLMDQTSEEIERVISRDISFVRGVESTVLRLGPAVQPPSCGSAR